MEAEWKQEGVWLNGQYIEHAETRHDAAKAVDEMVNALMELRRSLDQEPTWPQREVEALNTLPHSERLAQRLGR
jgi:hypothetical protein